MANKVFDRLLIEKIDQFRSAFSSTSKSVFYDDSKKRIFHTGEFGTYRESVVRDFLRFIIPRSLDISTGFLMTSLDDVSTQCDVVVFDSNMTPIYEEGDRQRFFPVESVHGIGEVKSTMSKADLKIALNKLARNKALSERMISTPTIVNKRPPGAYDPIDHPYDIIPSFLICQKLDFDIANIQEEIAGYYEEDIEKRHRHNLVLSIEDGLLAYFDSNSKTLPYPRLRRADLKDRFIYPDVNENAHFRLFSSYMFMVTSSKTLFYPDPTNYMRYDPGGCIRDKT
ncbi:MAG: DUF6602 domain-containing protein [Halieaceae bacterium]